MIIHCQTHCEYSKGLFPCFMFSFCKHLDTGKQIDKIKSNRFTITMDFQKLPFQSAIFFKTVCFILAEVFDKDDLHIAYKEQSFVARKDWEKREKLLVLDVVHPFDHPILWESMRAPVSGLWGILQLLPACRSTWPPACQLVNLPTCQLDHLLLLRRRSHLLDMVSGIFNGLHPISASEIQHQKRLFWVNLFCY